jgi:hypothetical protein
MSRRIGGSRHHGDFIWRRRRVRTRVECRARRGAEMPAAGLTEVRLDIDLDARQVTVDTIGQRSRIAYDSLIVATGASQLDRAGRVKVEPDCKADCT